MVERLLQSWSMKIPSQIDSPAIEYSVQDVSFPVRKYTGQAVKLQPTARNSDMKRGTCHADVTSNQGFVAALA